MIGPGRALALRGALRAHLRVTERSHYDTAAPQVDRHPEEPSEARRLEGWRPGPGRRPSRRAARAPQGDGRESSLKAIGIIHHARHQMDSREPRRVRPRLAAARARSGGGETAVTRT